MKNHIKAALIFVVLVLLLLATSLPAYATAGWGEMDERTGNASLLSAFIMFIFFWPLILIDLIAGILLYFITGVVSYSSPLFSSILGEINIFLIDLFCYIFNLLDWF